MRWMIELLGTRDRRAREATPEPAARAVAIRARLEHLATERLELLADESRPGRKHRLDAVSGAYDDLEAELRDLERAADPPGPA